MAEVVGGVADASEIDGQKREDECLHRHDRPECRAEFACLRLFPTRVAPLKKPAATRSGHGKEVLIAAVHAVLEIAKNPARNAFTLQIDGRRPWQVRPTAVPSHEQALGSQSVLYKQNQDLQTKICPINRARQSAL